MISFAFNKMTHGTSEFLYPYLPSLCTNQSTVHTKCSKATGTPMVKGLIDMLSLGLTISKPLTSSCLTDLDPPLVCKSTLTSLCQIDLDPLIVFKSPMTFLCFTDLDPPLHHILLQTLEQQVQEHGLFGRVLQVRLQHLLIQGHIVPVRDVLTVNVQIQTFVHNAE